MIEELRDLASALAAETALSERTQTAARALLAAAEVELGNQADYARTMRSYAQAQ